MSVLVAAALVSFASGCRDGDADQPTTEHGELSTAEYAKRRTQLVEKLGEEIKDRRVLDALSVVPRHEFVMARCRYRSYEDVGLPIAEDERQTMYSPHIVAQLTALLEIDPSDKVLEIGTGSGYQTAVLAELAKSVFTIEIVASLKEGAEKRLTELKERGELRADSKVHFVVGDGSKGLPDSGPYDAILVSAASKKVPAELEAQLAPGGRMVIPVGTFGQKLLLVERPKDGGAVRSREVGFVRWNELVGEGAGG